MITNRNEPMISVRELSVRYSGGVQALHPTGLRFEPGAFTVLLGSSGAGKSTLLRALNGLVTPTGGRVLVDGIGDIAERRRLASHRRRTGMVFQQHQLIGRRSVLSNVLMGRLGYHSSFRTLLPFPIAEKRLALSIIERVGLIDQALRRVDALSGGQQQRVGIARALVQQPRIVLADEPVASLDPATAEHVLGLLHDICKADGLTAIVSLHQLDFARAFADRIVGLAHGRVVFDGSPARLNDGAVRRIYGAGAPGANAQTTKPRELMTGTYA
jgi:phosphonate transport system ATP-binding protein